MRAADGTALYFSRAPIPWPRDAFARSREELPAALRAFRHIGIYAYRAEFLDRFVGWPVGGLEALESLEQLRALERGVRIKVVLGEQPFAGVDTPEQMAALERRGPSRVTAATGG